MTDGFSVYVVERIGSSILSRCTADVFETDTLTVSSIDDGAVLRIFLPGQWRECSVFEHDHPAFGFISKTACAPILSPAALRGKVA